MKKTIQFIYLTFLSLVVVSCGQNENEGTSFFAPPIVIPTVTTNEVTSVTSSSVVTGGIIVNNGGAAITRNGVCYSTSPNPTIANSVIAANVVDSGSYSVIISHLTPDTTYYARAYATNSAGTGYGNQVVFYPTYTIGQSYQGGIIFYVNSRTLHGLIVDSIDLGPAIWGCSETSVTTDSANGSQNTTNIVGACNTSGIAARLCTGLNFGGYSDWFLPSQNQLDSLYIQRRVVGISQGNYWSSTQYNDTAAYIQNFSNGNQSYVNKNNSAKVRAVRAF